MNERDIFLNAPADAAPEVLDAYLDDRCEGDAVLRRRVEKLLEADKSAGAYLDRGPVATTPSTNVATRGGELPGDVIGNYKLLQEIGEGGFGIVYMADQEKPVRRRVALKIIKQGMDTRQVIARFEAERQALAMMDHPNIARVFDAGSTENGRPYFVMELVRGFLITEYCDENRLGLEERLRLFMDVCHAVQHAHQKGVIHRDLKPANILITMHDDKAVPKVIDFGIAKATQQNLTDKTLFTRFEHFIGTPLYMSPEQAQMSGLDVDTRSDVYSLGVLLYELITGTTPFDARELIKSGQDEIRRRIREEEPPRPSTRVQAMTAEERTTSEQRRKMGRDHLRTALRGDLDLIVMKAMEKDRSRRYETANGLAADVQRFLNQEPIAAVGPSATYVLRKYAQRYRRALVIGAIVAFLILVGFTLSVWQAVRATRAEQEQGRLRVIAEAESTRATSARAEAEAQALASRRIAYASDMNVVQRELGRSNLGRAREILDRNRPEAGQEDLRGWEWRYLWRQCQGTPHRVLHQGDSSVFSLSVSHDGKHVAVSTDRVRILDSSKGEEVASWPGQKALFSPAAPWLVYWSAGNRPEETDAGPGEEGFRVWNVVTKKVEKFFPSQGSFYRGLSFSGDGSVLAIKTTPYNGADSQQLIFRSIPDGKRQQSIPSESVGPGSGYPFALARDMSIAAHGVGTARGKGTFRIIDVKAGEERWQSPPLRSGEWIETLELSPDNSMLAVGIGVNTHTIQIWDVRAGKEAMLAELEGHAGYVKDLLFFPDGKFLASASADQSIRIWNLSDLENIPEPRVLLGHEDEVACLDLFPDGKTLVSGSKDGVVLSWDSSSALSQPAAHFSSRNSSILSWEFRADEAALSVNYVPEAWEELPGAGLVALSPDGRFLAASTYTLKNPPDQSRIDVWNVETRMRSGIYGRFLKSCHSVAFSQDGRRLVGGSGGPESIKIWDFVSRQELITLESDTGPFELVRFSPDGNELAALSEGRMIHVWRAPSWEEVEAAEATESE